VTRREKLHADEDGLTALRAESGVGGGECCQEIATIGGLGQQLGAGGGEQLATECEFGGAVAVGQEAVIADALQAGRRHVLEEEADELVGGDGHDFGFACVAIVFPLEGNPAVFEGQQTAVGEGDAMGVAAEILQRVLGPAEGGLGINIDDIVGSKQAANRQKDKESLPRLLSFQEWLRKRSNQDGLG